MFIRGVIFGLFLFANPIFGQTFQQQQVLDFHQALIKKDTATLHQLVHDQLSYGHSNAWIENKTELLKNNASGYLQYQTISPDSIQIQQTGDVVIVRFNAKHEVIWKGQPLIIDLHVCQVWIWQQSKWQLMARQSTKRS